MFQKIKYQLYLIINYFYKKIYHKPFIEKNLYFIIEKNNWWTSKSQRHKIDMNAKIEYILINATYKNMMILKKNVNKNDVVKVFNKIKNDEWTLKKTKKNLINNFLIHVWK